jgi:predicted DNA-binding transcriptional regulator YafY
LRLLIDGLLFSKYIPEKQCQDLVEKLAGLANKYFNPKTKYIRKHTVNSKKKSQLFWNIELLDEAIANQKKVSFHFMGYGSDKELHKREINGKPWEYVLSPHQMVATNGCYYIIGLHDGKDKIYHYRLDLISDMKILDDCTRQINAVKGYERGLNLADYMAEHIYMYSDESDDVKFRADERIITAIIDWFGPGVKLRKDTKKANSVIAQVKVTKEAMLYWALQYGLSVEVLSPEDLREEIRQAVQEMGAKYGGGP